MSKQYRTAYITQHSNHNFEPLLAQCEDIKFCSTGYEKENELMEVLTASLVDFNPDVDVLVPVGNVTVNMLLGFILESANGFYMAIYRDKEYHIHRFGVTLRLHETI